MKIFVDGSTKPSNPGPGGFAVVVLSDDGQRVIECHQERREYTTNNEMELSACLYALLKYGVKEEKFLVPVVYCDSAYAINCLTIWKENWKQNNWLKSDGKIPENLTIIKNYDIIESKGYKIELRKIKGHDGIFGNEICDKLAKGILSEKEVMERYK